MIHLLPVVFSVGSTNTQVASTLTSVKAIVMYRGDVPGGLDLGFPVYTWDQFMEVSASIDGSLGGFIPISLVFHSIVSMFLVIRYWSGRSVIRLEGYVFWNLPCFIAQRGQHSLSLLNIGDDGGMLYDEQ